MWAAPKRTKINHGRAVANLKILHIVPSYLPARRYGGPILSIHGLCAESARQGHDVHVYTTNVDGRDNSDVPLGEPVSMEGVKVSYFPSKRLRRLYYSPQMESTLSGSIGKFDVLHLHSIFLWPTWMAARYARENNKPYLVAPRGMLVKELVNRRGRLRKTAWIRLIEKQNLERADVVHVTSEKEGAEIRRFGFALRRLEVIPNGCSVISDEIFHTSVSSVERPKVLYLGRLSWKKGLDRLIESMVFVPDADLILAGNDEEAYRVKLDSVAERHGLTKRIEYLGFVDGAEKSRLLRSAHMLVLPSYSENFGNVVLEAMTHGCPVIVTPEVGIAESVRTAGAGWVVPGEPAQLGAAIARLCSNEEERKRLGECGRWAVEREFAWPHVTERMLSLYRDIAGGSIRG